MMEGEAPSAGVVCSACKAVVAVLDAEGTAWIVEAACEDEGSACVTAAEVMRAARKGVPAKSGIGAFVTTLAGRVHIMSGML